MTQPKTQEVPAYLQEQELTAKLQPYTEWREVEAKAKKEKDALGKEIRAWLETHPGEELQDGERGIEAFLEKRQAADTYDLVKMPDALVLWAARMGLLSADDKMVRAQAEKFIEAVDMRKWAMPGKPSTALQVVEAKP